MALTDQQLLLLDNFMYFNGSENPDAGYATLGEMAQDFLDNPEEHKPARWDSKEYEEVLKAIIKDDTLSHLGLGAPTNPETDDLIRGRCFIEYGENNEVLGHVVAFRGTIRAMEPWIDNFQGLYMEETEAQRLAKEYIKGLGFDDITVTGHSKGGNLSMYVTMMCGEQIDRCVSYNGQGFGENCLENISEEQLAEASAKMTSVCTRNDYVNILLTTVAGRNYYVANGDEDCHGIYSLYENNKKLLKTTEGMFTGAIAEEQDGSMTLADYVLDTIIHFLPEDESILVGGAGGNIAAAALADDFSLEDCGESILETLQDYAVEKFELDLLGNLAGGAVDSIGEFGGSMADGFGEIWDGNWEDGLGNIGDGFVELGSDFCGGVMDVVEEVADEFDFLWAKLPTLEKTITYIPPDERFANISHEDLRKALRKEESIEVQSSSHISSSGHSHGGGGRRREASTSRER